ncbi:MAG: hypothetical protein NVSMB65_02610 [Chloroflexota bacterium]
MEPEPVLVIAIEDLATAGIVAVEAAHIAQEHGTAQAILLHVLDPHPILSGVAAMSGYAMPMRETPEEAEFVLDLADRLFQAEFAAVGKPMPTIQHEVAEGPVGEAIARTVRAHGAQGIVLGARRPHAFGRLVHPDVRSHVTGHMSVKVHVAQLQASS